MGKWISVYLDDETFNRLKELEERGDINRSKFIRRAIQERLERLKKLGLL